MRCFVIAWTVLLACISPAFSQGWEWLNPLPQGNTLNAVNFISQDVGWAAGVHGTVIHTTDGGTTWALQNTGSMADLNGVAFVGTNGWAVGENGTILHTSDGGGQWDTQTSGTSFALNAVSFVDSLNGWAVGGFWFAAWILHTTDGGSTWIHQEVDTYGLPYDVVFLDALNGWVAARGADWYQHGVILHTTNAGTTWTEYQGGIQPFLTHIALGDPEHGWAVGESDTLYQTTDGGASWTAQLSSGSWYRSIVAHGPDSVWALTPTTLLRTTDGGMTWIDSVLISGGQSLRDVFFLDSRNGFIVGDAGWIFKTINGGEDWAPFHQNAYGTLVNIDFVDPDHGWVVGVHGTVLHTSDGLLWQEQASGLGTEDRLCAVSFANPSVGWAVTNQTIIHTSDGGETWNQQASDPAWQLSDVAAGDPLTAWVVGAAGTWLHRAVLRTTNAGSTWTVYEDNENFGERFVVTAVDANRVWTAGGDMIRYSSDGGLTWAMQDSGGTDVLTDIVFTDALHGWAVGINPTVRHTSDGGLSWDTQFSTNDTAQNVTFSNALNGWVALQAGRYIHTIDGGETWEFEYLPAGITVSATSLVDASHGWAVGWAGTILKWDGTANGIALPEHPALPTAFWIAAYPNPFNSSTRLSFDLPQAGHIHLAVYDLTGRLVRMLADRVVPPGDHTLIFDGADLPSGMYFVRLSAKQGFDAAGQGNSFSQTRKLLLLK